MKRQQLTRHGPVWKDSGVDFRLWAPSARSVELVLDQKSLPMTALGDGWYVKQASPQEGNSYAFLINGETKVPDPASRFQPQNKDGMSAVHNALAFDWTDSDWKGRPWEEAVIYELHVGCFSPEGTYQGIEKKLDYLVSLGITAIELMPLSNFVGKRGWGYDGVLPYAPQNTYGTPNELKHLINTAHQKGLMVFLDVVYNHFGPAGNYLHLYAESFFTDHYKTPWGSAINVEASQPVRDFFVDNALFWLNEYNFDGLRFDAVHAISDSSDKHFLYELAETVRQQLPQDRHIHLVLENDKNQARYLAYDVHQKPTHFTAQWNDDIHHCFHTLLTGEEGGYYSDYSVNKLDRLGQCLAQGFNYQGEASHHRGGEARGEPSHHLPPQAFVAFIQNHDQIGNRAFGERLASLTSKEKLTLASTILLLSPQPPLLFMGEEWGTENPFLYFCDFDGELAHAVREGRRKEFESFPAFASPEARAKIPDPNAEDTFAASCLKWDELKESPHNARGTYTARMLELRKEYIWPLLKTRWIKNSFKTSEAGLLQVRWDFEEAYLILFANFSDHALEIDIAAQDTHMWGALGKSLPAWKTSWFVGPQHV